MHDSAGPADVEALNALARAKGWTFFCHDDTEFEAPRLNAMRVLWQAHAAPGKLPGRADFSARAMKDFLSYLLIVDVVPAPRRTRYRYRYVGTKMAHYLGEWTGKYMDEALPPEVFERTAACYDAIVRAHRPLRIVTHFSLEKIDYLTAEFFCAPLASDGVVPDMVMTVTDFRLPQ